MTLTQIDDTLNILSQATAYYGYVHIVQDVTITTTTLVSDEITDSVSSYDFLADGYFIITEIKLPTNPTAGVYYLNGDKIIDPNGDEITAEELLAINPEGTNITRTDQDYITMYFLNDYYIELIKSKFMHDICSCGCGCADKQDKVKLDALTMGLDLATILNAQAQYHEVQRIVEKLQACFGMVDNNCNCK